MSSSAKFWKTKEFKKLDEKWKKELEKSGFEDAEQDDDHLKLWSTPFARKKSVDSYKFKQEYYYMCTHFLNDYTFGTTLEKTIWEYHAEGVSVRNISLLLKKVKIKKSRYQVWVLVKRLETIMYSLYNKGS